MAARVAPADRAAAVETAVPEVPEVPVARAAKAARVASTGPTVPTGPTVLMGRRAPMGQTAHRAN